MSEQLLDLSQITAPRDYITLPSKKDDAGKPYEIVNPNDLGILALQRLFQLQEEENRLRASASAKKAGLTPAQSRALRKCLGSAIKILMPSIDEATLNLLPNEARERIILAWTVKHYGSEAATEDGEPSAEGEAQRRRTGAISSHGSKPSTAATRKPGSTARRGS